MLEVLRKLSLGMESSLLLWVRERSALDTQMGGICIVTMQWGLDAKLGGGDHHAI
jgi:hypothetical protein